jgi:hypothetical protein
MTELRLCPACHRHVATREVACPFCACALAPARGQHIQLVGRVSRAAVFSAALAACSSEKPAAPAPAPPAQGSDDLEKMLDTDERVVPRADAPTPIDAASADAAVVDAAVPVDAGVVRKKKQQQQVPLDEPVKTVPDHMIHAKPYGAPPARRRIV